MASFPSRSGPRPSPAPESASSSLVDEKRVVLAPERPVDSLMVLPPPREIPGSSPSSEPPAQGIRVLSTLSEQGYSLGTYAPPIFRPSPGFSPRPPQPATLAPPGALSTQPDRVLLPLSLADPVPPTQEEMTRFYTPELGRKPRYIETFPPEQRAAVLAAISSSLWAHAPLAHRRRDDDIPRAVGVTKSDLLREASLTHAGIAVRPPS